MMVAVSHNAVRDEETGHCMMVAVSHNAVRDEETGHRTGQYVHVEPGPTENVGTMKCGCQVWFQTEKRSFAGQSWTSYNGIVGVIPGRCKKKHPFRSLTWELPKSFSPKGKENRLRVAYFLSLATKRVSKAESHDSADLRSQRAKEYLRWTRAARRPTSRDVKN